MGRIEIATPNYLLTGGETEQWPEVSLLTDCIELRDTTYCPLYDHKFILHADLSIVSPWEDEALQGLRETAARYGPSLVSFHIASRYARNSIVEGAFVGRGAPMERDEMLSNARQNMSGAREVFPAGTVFCVENNNHLGTDAYDVVTEGSFISEVTGVLDIGFLWDMAHSAVTSLNTGTSHKDYLASLPMQRCFQVHISGYDLDEGGKALDAHRMPGQEEFQALWEQLPFMPDLQFVTIEFYGSGALMASGIKDLKEMLGEK
ncbi:MAG: DUF692 family protein [Thermodesulfovibrionales bacterium]|nr:DUF692 family protein [Thermodesulfovibrionales bacterium]